MNELSLFSGAGGGLIGTKALGFNHIGYVEFKDYCQQVLAKRIKEGNLDEAPIFTDVREFLESGAARQYRGAADVPRYLPVSGIRECSLCGKELTAKYSFSYGISGLPQIQACNRPICKILSLKYLNWMRLECNFIFAWYDLWIGAFYDKSKQKFYIFLIPMIGIVIDLETPIARRKRAVEEFFRNTL